MLQGRRWNAGHHPLEPPEGDLASFRFKALHPTFDGAPIKVNGQRSGNEVKLWAQDRAGWLTMDAQATLRWRNSRREPSGVSLSSPP